MKKYIILFLVLLTNLAYAPTLTDDIKQQANRETKERIHQLIEQERDNNDIIFLTKLNMLSRFSFEDRVKARCISDSLRINPKWLYQIISIESRGVTTAINPLSGASGLIGFLPSTALKLGTDINSIRVMNTNNQLDYVGKYLRLASNGKHLRSLLDLYLAIFSPNSINQKESYVIGNKYSKVYNQNKTLDVNRDSMITIRDIKLYINRIFI